MNLGQYIKNRRIELNMTQETLAKKINKNKTFVSRLEKGNVKSLKDYMMDPLAKALNISIIDLFELNENSNIEKQKISVQEAKDEIEKLVNMSDMTEQQKEMIMAPLNYISEEEKNNK